MKYFLVAALGAALLAGPILAQSEDGQGHSKTHSHDNIDREHEAEHALEALQIELTKKAQPEGKAAQKKFFSEARDQLLKLATDWDGTDASLQAMQFAAQVDIYMLDQVDRGLKMLGKVYNKAKKRPAELLKRSQVTPGKAGLAFAEALIQNDKLEKAEKVLKDVLAMDGIESERAEFHLGRLKTLSKMAIGKTIPTFTGKDLDGKDLTPEQYRGKVTLVDFWATWCGPCVAEMPNVVAAYEKYHKDGFDVMGISLDKHGDDGKVREFAEQYNMPWRHVYDGKGWGNAVAEQFAISSIPATFLLDRNGVIRYKGIRGDALEEAIQVLLAEDANAN